MAFQFIAFTPCSGSSGTYFVASYDAAFWTAVQGTTVTFDSYQVNACFQPSLPGIIINPGDPPPAGYDPSVDLTTIAYSTYNNCSECLENVSPAPNYKLVDCDNPGNTLCISNTLVPGLLAVVKIEGYPNTCWSITTDPLCTNPVYVTFTNVFKSGCAECKQTLPVTNYELRSCQDDSVIYTSTDLSEYTDQVVTLDGYDDCYFVRVLPTGIPGDTPVTVTASFADCELCQATYYQLTACAPNGALDSIVTITDLSAYVGSIITLETCPDICWQVSETTAVEKPQEVTVLGSYTDCTTCTLAVLPAICVTFTNTSDNIINFSYTDSTGFEHKVNIEGKGSIVKVCAVYWDTPEFLSVTQYGNCINNECPVIPQPKRAVTPGYNTPVCSTDYYEKVECAFGESMYKDVLSERYGISNCCPENDMKWIIKHEMLMLDILVNPDYTCTPITSCNCPVIGGTVLNTACPDVTQYIIERCDSPGVTEVVRIDNQYDVLGNVILIDDVCYTVVEPTNRLVTVYWIPGEIYVDCIACPTP